MDKKMLLTLAAAGFLAACGSSSSSSTPYLTFQGNGNAANGAVFNAAHAGQTVRAALLDGSNVLDIQKATVAAAGTDPAFSVTFAPVLDMSKAYTVNYWIDSNFGLTPPAGVAECDAPANDHQWSVAIPAGQTSFVDIHRPASTQNVCSTFTFPLTFVGDATFIPPHSGQTFKAALVRGSDNSAEETLSGTVAATGSPAFSVTFAHKLVINEPYSVKLWVDFNSNGTCQAPPTDHQWSIPIPTALASHNATVPYTHNTTFTDVCSFFP
ncbi:MAG TPA: hypothetical protein VIW03_15130 [Anaeromyxobacter sp.]